jgi:hypothetical protein
MLEPVTIFIIIGIFSLHVIELIETMIDLYTLWFDISRSSVIVSGRIVPFGTMQRLWRVRLG